MPGENWSEYEILTCVPLTCFCPALEGGLAAEKAAGISCVGPEETANGGTIDAKGGGFNEAATPLARNWLPQMSPVVR